MKLESNPIGIVQNIPEIEEKIIKLKSKWDEKFSDFYKNWTRYLGLKSRAISLATNFLIFALDELVKTVSVVVISGPDKKATVLAALDRLYEYVIKESLPVWLKPFASVIKQYVIYSLASCAIDYIVSNYKNGNWKTGG